MLAREGCEGAHSRRGGGTAAPDGVVGVRRWRMEGLSDVEVCEVDRSSRRARGFEEAYTFVVRTEGGAGVRYRRRVHEHRQGEMLMCEPGETYEVLRADGPVSALVLSLSPALVSRVAVEHRGHGNEVHWRRAVTSSSRVGGAMTRVVEALRSRPRLEAIACVSRFVAGVIEQFAELGGRTREEHAPVVALTRARDLLHARFSEAVTLDDLVRVADCTTKQRLNRGFHAMFGFTPHQYLTQLRIQRARDLLRRGHGCGETAHAVGFYDQSQLNRHFMKHLGVTPGAYARGVL
jgi:AraC-like DNA-binding protein